MKYIRKLYMIIVLYICTVGVVFADFNSDAANKTLDSLSLTLSTQNLNAQSLNDAANTLVKLQEGANTCIKDKEAEVNQINTLLPEEISNTPTPVSPQSDVQYLLDKQRLLKSQIAQCRIFVLRSQEAIDAYSKAAQEIATSKVLEKGPNVISNFKNFSKALHEMRENFSFTRLIDGFGFNNMNVNFLVALALSLLIVNLVVFKLKKIVKLSISKEEPQEYAQKVWLSFLCVLDKYSYFLASTGLILIDVSIMGAYYNEPKYLLLSLLTITTAVLFYAVAEFLFHPPKPAKAFVPITIIVAQSLLFRLRLFLIALSVIVIIGYIFQEQQLPVTATALLSNISIIIIAILLVSILWVINKAPKLLYQYTNTRKLISIGLVLFLTVILSASLIGYQFLAQYLTKAIALSVVFTIFAGFVYKVLASIIALLSDNKSIWQQKLHQYLGLKKDEILTEVVVLHIPLFIIVWFAYAVAMLSIWGLPEVQIYNVVDGFINGFKIGNVELFPMRVIVGFGVFVFFCLFTRFISQRIKNSTSLQGTNQKFSSRGAREAFATIFAYIGFTLSLIFSMIIAGVNFAGLTIIAGALSVGIGFGLQGIVNNFVSGLILLIERPIKPGDRVIIDGQESFVKKVSIRSTVVVTLDQTDIIVPNADLISTRVTNYTLGSLDWRIVIFVGVAYDSDVDLVHETMMKVAHAHKLTIKEGYHAPMVLFHEFGESALVFELRCVIVDVNQKDRTKSELHFAINKAFRDNNITIAYPQTDLHIKNIPPLDTPSLEST